jgi:hypothetical protein
LRISCTTKTGDEKLLAPQILPRAVFTYLTLSVPFLGARWWIRVQVVVILIPPTTFVPFVHGTSDLKFIFLAPRVFSSFTVIVPIS